MTPALGTQSPETRHLNLKWSIGDIDRVVKMAREGRTAIQISDGFAGTSLASSPREIVEICQSMNRFIRFGERRA